MFATTNLTAAAGAALPTSSAEAPPSSAQHVREAPSYNILQHYGNSGIEEGNIAIQVDSVEEKHVWAGTE